MDRYKRDTGAYKASINNAAIELFLNNMEEYKINFRYFITIEFSPKKAISSLIDKQIKHLDNVNKALFSSNKRNVDAPGLIYIKERYNHNRSEFHLHVFLEEVSDAILQKHIDEIFLVSSKSGIMVMVKEDWGMKMLAANSDYTRTRTRTFYLI
jgi:predicted DNA-binding protein